jgi:hypothetical protein
LSNALKTYSKGAPFYNVFVDKMAFSLSGDWGREHGGGASCYTNSAKGPKQDFWVSSGTPYFTENPGDPYKAWDMSRTLDYLPGQYITFRWEYDYRAANVPYFGGPGGVTPPEGNQGALGSLVPGGAPDLRKNENRLSMAILVKF